jgi:pimeloyl-ACP methyl ester carboxylesterase
LAAPTFETTGRDTPGGEIYADRANLAFLRHTEDMTVTDQSTRTVPVLVSERIGQFYFEGSRLEYTEYGAGERVLVLLHAQLVPRRMHDPLARNIASQGYRVITLDLLGHGRSDRPRDPKRYSMTAFAQQVLALLDHLGLDSAVVGGTSLGANVTLELADEAPERLRGMLLEMPVLDNALEAGIVAFGPLLFLGRVLPWTVNLVTSVTRSVPRGLVPFWVGIALDTLSQEPGPMAATVHGIFFGRVAPSSRRREQIEVPAIVIGHPHDPIHPAADAAMLSEELPNSTFVEAESIIEWRSRPARITGEVLAFLDSCWPREARSARARRRTAAKAARGTAAGLASERPG